MAFSVNDMKKFCKEKGYAFRAASLFGGIGKNDSGKWDFTIEANGKKYACKVLTTPADAERVYFKHVGGDYITVKSASGDADYLWVAPKAEDDVCGVLLLDRDLPATELSKNSVVTVTAGSSVYGCRVYTPATAAKLFA